MSRLVVLKRVMSGLLCVLMLMPMLLAEDAPEKQPPTKQKPGADAPKIEVVFVLDTTGSMSGLIAAAKDKIWAIANSLALAEPTPDIKMGLIGYRDRNDAYVTKLTDLTDNLDKIYTELMDFEAGGGGDTPESVNQALDEAVQKFAWSKDESTYKVIYLVGDAPPHMDYENESKYPEICETAVKADIVINAIQCGNMAATTPIWREIASLSEGRFFQIAQSGGEIVKATPYDKEISELSRKLDGTRVWYGDAKQQAAQSARDNDLREAEEDAASAAPSARRAIYNASKAGKKNFIGGPSTELVDAIESGDVALDKVEQEKLPENLKGLSQDELKEEIAKKAAEREKLQAKIRELGQQRQKFIEEDLKKRKEEAPKLDVELYSTIKEQAAKKGIEYKKDGPAY
ncbi:VWA domain-containing protein [Calycomorphotria hydatis]|uniref:VWFA domain-containing protein n=1 Tax=Calycomorphotria hydatis TaxID=2528027 RepID=A0A517TB18_9PLAN|nr:VWA domain-containing protein [Calycomorphotria hydatis]QDT65573.1 hypothetical protein V22_28280 [Calycomorphotria hydatis]